MIGWELCRQYVVKSTGKRFEELHDKLRKREDGKVRYVGSDRTIVVLWLSGVVVVDNCSEKK